MKMETKNPPRIDIVIKDPECVKLSYNAIKINLQIIDKHVKTATKLMSRSEGLDDDLGQYSEPCSVWCQKLSGVSPNILLVFDWPRRSFS